MAGIHRSSTLPKVNQVDVLLLGMAGIHRSSTLADDRSRFLLAGDGRDSPLKYTGGNMPKLYHALGMAGIHR